MTLECSYHLVPGLLSNLGMHAGRGTAAHVTATPAQPYQTNHTKPLNYLAVTFLCCCWLFGLLASLKGEEQDSLAFMTAQYHLAVVSYDGTAGDLSTRACDDVKERVYHSTESRQVGVIDPNGKVMVLHFYAGLLKEPSSRCLKTVMISVKDKDINSGPWKNISVEPQASLLHPGI